MILLLLACGAGTVFMVWCLWHLSRDTGRNGRQLRAVVFRLAEPSLPRRMKSKIIAMPSPHHREPSRPRKQHSL